MIQHLKFWYPIKLNDPLSETKYIYVSHDLDEKKTVAVSQFKVCILESMQFEVIDVITLHKVYPSSLNTGAYSKRNLK